MKTEPEEGVDWAKPCLLGIAKEYNFLRYALHYIFYSVFLQKSKLENVPKEGVDWAKLCLLGIAKICVTLLYILRYYFITKIESMKKNVPEEGVDWAKPCLLGITNFFAPAGRFTAFGELWAFSGGVGFGGSSRLDYPKIIIIIIQSRYQQANQSYTSLLALWIVFSLIIKIEVKNIVNKNGRLLICKLSLLPGFLTFDGLDFANSLPFAVSSNFFGALCSFSFFSSKDCCDI